MKGLIASFSCMLLCSNAVMATLTGGDDFNDGMIDTGQWGSPIYIGNAGLSETNGHLHFYTLDNPGTDAYRAILPFKVAGPFNEDWEVQVYATIPDFENESGQRLSIGLVVVPAETAGTGSNQVSLTITKNEENQKQYFQNVDVNGVEVDNNSADRFSDIAILRMRWQAATSNLYSDVSLDGGTTWTSYWPSIENPFNMTNADQFIVTLYTASHGWPIAISDNLYFDDFRATIYSGPLNGSDDFNDNVRDTSKWLEGLPLLAETNNRLEFTSTGSGQEQGMWMWTANTGSYTQDWSVTIDAVNSSTPSADQFSNIALVALNSADGTDLFGALLGIGTDGCNAFGGWEIDGASYWIALQAVTNNTATLKISYDATTRTLSSSFDAGDGYVSLTNFNVTGWSMNTNDTFMIGVSGYAEYDFAIESGQMYLDNFEAHTLTTTPALFSSIVCSNLNVSLSVIHLTDSASNVLERSFDLTDSNGWHTIKSFISATSQTNITDVISNTWQRTYYRIKSQ